MKEEAKEALKALARTFMTVFTPIATFVSLYLTATREPLLPITITVTGSILIVLILVVTLGAAIVHTVIHPPQ